MDTGGERSGGAGRKCVSWVDSRVVEAYINRLTTGGPMNGLGALAVCMLAMAGTSAFGQEARFKPLGEKDMTDAQRKVHKEIAILITARHWTAQYEWHAHHALALKAGLNPQLAADLAQGKRPAGMKDDETAVYDFCRELHESKAVSDSAYNAVADKFGERGVVDLIGVSGYYTLVSMVLNVDRHPLPAGVPAPLPLLK